MSSSLESDPRKSKPIAEMGARTAPGASPADDKEEQPLSDSNFPARELAEGQIIKTSGEASIVAGVEIVGETEAQTATASLGATGRPEPGSQETPARVVILDKKSARHELQPAAISRESAGIEPGEIVNNLLKAFRRVSQQVVGREDLLHQTLYALLTREHQLIYSRAGMAKSLYATAVFGQFRNTYTFSMQLTKGTPEEGLVGAIDIGELKKGNIIHNTSGSIVEAQLAFLDEIFDANDVALRSLLGILNERSFRKGKQQVEAVMHSAIATSNYVRANDVTEAVIDRFAFRALLLPSADPYEMLRIDRAYGDNVGQIELPGLEQRVPIEHLEYLSDIVEGRVPERRITCSSSILFLKNAVIQEYVKLINTERQKHDQSEIYISPRTMAKARDVLNASALLHGRSEVNVDDLSELRYMITTVGDSKHQVAFDQALSSVLTRYSERDLKTVNFLMGAHELLEEMLSSIEDGRKIRLSLLQRLQVFFGLTSYHEITFSNITGAVQVASADNPEIEQMKNSLLQRIEKQRARLDGGQDSLLI